MKLNNFVRNFVAQTIIGMVKSLRGVGAVEIDQPGRFKKSWVMDR